MGPPTDTLSRLRAQARSATARDALDGLVAAYDRNDLLTAASAISFHVLFALVPFALFVLGLLGGAGLDEIWSRELAPDVQGSTSPAAFLVIDDTVRKVLGERQGFWMTVGAVITVWKISGATRSVMGVFDRVYGCEEERSLRTRLLVSLWLSAATGALLMAAVAVFALGPLLGGTAVTVARWPVAAVLLFATMYLFVSFAPADRQPADWVSFGAVLVVVSWLGATVAFAFYAREIADYGSIFGALATVIIVFTYIYVSSLAFLTGAQVDALVRDRVADEDDRPGRATPAVATG